jgi:hypothetical protein
VAMVCLFPSMISGIRTFDARNRTRRRNIVLHQLQFRSSSLYPCHLQLVGESHACLKMWPWNLRREKRHLAFCCLFRYTCWSAEQAGTEIESIVALFEREHIWSLISVFRSQYCLLGSDRKRRDK